MSKSNRKKQRRLAKIQATADSGSVNQPGDGGGAHAFSFGDPEPVLSNNMTDYIGTFMDATGVYYTPPVSLSGLADLISANPYHGPILHFKKNMIVKWFVPHAKLSKKTFEKVALNYLVTGNTYLQNIRNGFDRLARLDYLPALPMPRAKEKNRYLKILKDGGTIEFKEGEVLHLLEPDIKQEIYGVPEYLGGIHSILLSEESTLFRRKYYINGAHMGYILVTNDAGLDDPTTKLIEEKVRGSKGPGNFRSLFLNIPKSKSKEPVQVIPVGNIGNKDEYERIKGITEREMLAMHRVPPGLAGIIPENAGGFGDMKKLLEAYHELEIIPMQDVFLEINDLVGETVVRFKDPDWKEVNPNAK